MSDDANNLYGPVLDIYEDPAIDGDGFDESTEFPGGGDLKGGPEMLPSMMREYPAHQRVDKEIDYMEAQLRGVVSKVPSGCQQDL